jgi:hypothetical protein
MTLMLQGGCDRQNYGIMTTNRSSTTRMVRRPRFLAQRLYINHDLSVVTQFYSVMLGRHATGRLKTTKRSITWLQSSRDCRHSIAMGNIAAIWYFRATLWNIRARNMKYYSTAMIWGTI